MTDLGRPILRVRLADMKPGVAKTWRELLNLFGWVALMLAIIYGLPVAVYWIR